MLPVPELLSTLSPAPLRALLAAFGPVPLLAPNASPLTAARVLFAYPSSYPVAAPAAGTPRLPAKLTRFLFSVFPRFGTESGRHAFIEAGRAVGDPRVEAWRTMPAPDLAVRLALEDAGEKGSARKRAKLLFALAGLRLNRDLPERATYELRANAPVERAPKRAILRLQKALGANLIRAFSALDHDGTLRLALFLRQPTRRVLRLDSAASDGLTSELDEVTCVDHVCISPDGMRVAIMMAQVDLLPDYARALDLSLSPSFTLRALQLMTAAQLEALAVPRVEGIEIVGTRKRGPDGSRTESRRPGIDPAHQEGTGYLDRVTARGTVDGAKKVDAFLQLPHRFDLSDRSLEEPMRAALEALGTFTPGALPDDARSLAPYEHGAWRWSAVVGEATFERMRSEGRFTRVVLAHVATREYRMHGSAYVVRDVPDHKGMQYALSEDRSLGARVVSEEDRAAWRLDLTVLRQGMAREIGALPAATPLHLPGLLDLGVVHLPSARLRVVYAMAEPPPDWINALLLASGVMTPLVLVPRGHAVTGVLVRMIELDVDEQLGAKSVARALGRAAEALGIPNDVEAWRRYEEEVVLEAASNVAWVLRVRVALPEHPFKLLAHLAKNRGATTPTSDLGLAISKGGEPDVRARKAKAALEKCVTEALVEAGVDPALASGLIIADGRKGYRLGMTARVV
jgi:hypothetical protein